MASSSWQLLDLEDENQLHKSRLFSIEEKPFKRITKRLATINHLANSKIRQTLTPPPETAHQNGGGGGDDNEDEDAAPPATDFVQLKEDMTLDFAAFDYTIGRLQFLQSANAAQRERYASERGQILETCSRVRDNTAVLRARLAEAQATRARRTAWDGLARSILDNKALQERPKARAGIDKLEEECRQLEAESDTYAATWRERREQFSRIMDESMRLRRLIRDEKEEVERREGMDEDGEGSGEGDGPADGHTPRPGSASGNGTPRPEGVASAVPKGLGENGDSTPRPTSVGGRTPMRDSPAPSAAAEGGLKPPPDAHGNQSQAGSRPVSRDASPARTAEPDGRRDGEDVEMGEFRDEATSTPKVTVEGRSAEDKMDIS